MFGNKNKKIESSDGDLTSRVNQDMVVRNMPNFTRASVKPLNSNNQNQSSNSILPSSGKKQNFKMVGLVIIAGGLLFIGGLVYLSYIFIIKPQTNKDLVLNTAPPVVVPAVISNLLATTTEEIVISTSTEVATVTPNVIELASTSDELIMNEELNGKQGTDLPPLLDTDNDGLNDEEEQVLGTNASLADSNGNTYTDLVEINNGYDPVVSGKLNENPNLEKYVNKTLLYEMLYPKSWLANSLTGDATITFTAPDDSIIQVSVQDNSDHQSILGWYGTSFPDATITYEKLKSTPNWDGIFGANGLNFYLTDKKRNTVYIISYIPSVDGRVAYPNIFNLMINSLIVK